MAVSKKKKAPVKTLPTPPKPVEPTYLKYDFGCGPRKQPGHIGVDISDIEGVDIVADLMKFPYKFAKTNSANEIFCSHFFEHMDGQERIAFMKECYRILIPGGKLTVITPHWSSERSVQDPTHKWPPIVGATFLYFNRGWMEQNGLLHYGPNNNGYEVDFDFTYGYSMDQETQNKNQDQQQFSMVRYNNAIQDIFVTLTSRKEAAKK